MRKSYGKLVCNMSPKKDEKASLNFIPHTVFLNDCTNGNGVFGYVKMIKRSPKP